MEQDSQEADDDDYHGTTNGTSLYRKTLGIAPSIENATRETGQGIDVTTENKRYFVYQDIAQDTSAHSRDHSDEDGEIGVGIRQADICRFAGFHRRGRLSRRGSRYEDMPRHGYGARDEGAVHIRQRQRRRKDRRGHRQSRGICRHFLPKYHSVGRYSADLRNTRPVCRRSLLLAGYL